ncbi:ABC transporter substrate-binding protein [Alicycliphilus denitrificans]|uniref:ABC transporter substrate-binding protein n=1 Tax=Alicycliphilus denitrificans TaxID=179636 RepID=A0A858ZVU2_9BURK|nr:ABC transporter substrate-binding protein [Alicycliphilus denitrificans]QKD44918.1 ABC transporter substrate-binding protein [Alicycliphilus denitrificans]
MHTRCLSLAFTIVLMALSVVAVLGAAPVFAAQVVVGQVGPMSGLESTQSRAYSAGMRLHFDALNKADGINGHTFVVVHKDDRGSPEDTVALTKKMIAEDRPLVLAGYFGSRNVADLVTSGLLEKNRIALVGYRISEIGPETPYLYNVRAGLRDELHKLTEHLATIGITRLGLFHEDGPGSSALVGAAEEAARKTKVSFTVRASYAANTASVSDAVDRFIKQPPQAILMISSGGATAGFIEKYRTAGGSAQLLAHSSADIEQLSRRLADEHMRSVVVAQVTPSPYKISSRLTKEFNEAVSRAGAIDAPVSYAMMEGYIAARVIAEAVRRQGSNLSRFGTVLALDGINDFDIGGYFISFRSGQRSGSQFVELTIVSAAGGVRR